MTPPKILAIAPYEGMKELITTVAQSDPDVDVTAYVGNLQEAVDLVREMDLSSYDLLLSRGGTLELLKPLVDLPVLEINISVYDVLRTIKLAEHYTQKFAIVGYPSITEAAQILCDLLKYDIDIYTLDSRTQVEKELRKLKQAGYGMVLSDVIGFQIAKSIGLNAILITSGVESIENAMGRAKELYYNIHHLMKQKHLYGEILRQTEQTFFVHDSTGQLITSHILPKHIEHSDMIHQQILAMSHRGRAATDEEIAIDQTHFQFSRSTLTSGTDEHILTLIHSWQVKKDQVEGISILQNPSRETSLFEDFNHISYIGNIDDELVRYAKPIEPVIIIGEGGTGKDKAAYTLYSNGPFSTASFYQIDAQKLTERSRRYLLEHTDSPLNAMHHTIYFKNLHILGSDALMKLADYLEDSMVTQRNKVIFSLIPTISDPIREFIKKLTYSNGALSVNLEPLRNRRNEIPNIASLYLNMNNTAFGKEIVGFEPDALEILQAHTWPDNLDEMKSTLRECVLLSNKPYITRSILERVLKQNQHTVVSEEKTGYISIDSTKSLEEITLELVKHVLAQENQNQQKTASRLGISRSTLWRMLKANNQ